MNKLFQDKLGNAIARCLKYCNFADEYYPRTDGGDTREVFHELLDALHRHRLVGPYDLNKESTAFLPPGWKTNFKLPQGSEAPNALAQEAVLAAMTEFCNWHFARLDAGPQDDPWFLRSERQAVLEILRTWEACDMLQFSVSGENRGVRLIEWGREPCRAPDPIQRPRPR